MKTPVEADVGVTSVGRHRMVWLGSTFARVERLADDSAEEVRRLSISHIAPTEHQGALPLFSRQQQR